ncbi:hypothetical protein LUZ60_005928 [Juncus effusus]|nr:hypothetical protein LUZ60_005928 [Juncus effusus]
MATSFDRWEKDPFFAAAEEVQESSDRMESVYRSWIQERNNGLDQNSDLGLSDLPRELHTALGTAKWQLEELERAVKSNDEAYSAGEDTRTRHTQFISAIKSRISMVESSLKESNVQRGENQLSWVRLDQEERDELALFLSCPSKTENPFPKDTVIDFPDSSESTSSESKDLKKKKNKHRRALSADKDIGSWKINMPSEGEDTSERSSEERERMNMPLPKIHSFSGLNGTLEVKPRVKWYKNGARKGQNGHREDLEACLPLKNVQLNQEIEEACYERKGCLSTCGDENCEKQINGWIGAFQRQIQRSQYQIQYGRPIQIVIMVFFALLLIFMFVWSTSW